MAVCRCIVLLACLGSLGAVSGSNLASGTKVSPVQKVLQLMDECRGKILKDLSVEQAAMDQYMLFSHKEIGAKANAIKSATRDIQDLEATISENDAIILESTQEVADLGSRIAAKQGELGSATSNRDSQHAEFAAAEKELLDAVGMTERAVAQLKEGVSFTQVDSNGMQNLEVALQRIIDSEAIIADAPKERLQAFLQSADASSQGDELAVSFKTALRQPEQKAFESKSGAILETVEGMQKKAEDQLAALRKKEMENNHAFEMLADSLNNEISQATAKLQANQSLKAASEEKLAQAQEDLGSTKKTKGDDEAYSATTKQECQMKSQEFEERMISAKGELGAIAKATDILKNGVVALVQTGGQAVVSRHVRSTTQFASDDEDRRLRAATQLRNLGVQYHKIGFMELATAVASDPFVKIRGLVEDMIAKLQAEAAEEASHKAFCDQEMGKSTAAKKIKETKMEKHQTRMDQASSEIAELTAAVQRLESEVAEIDAAMAEATQQRTTENQANTQAMSDFRQSADAYKKLSQENKLSRAQKETDAHGKRSEIKSLEVSLSHNSEDHTAVSSELDAVNAYLDKLKPECETKVMSYGERKAAREAEIEGLKDAMSILQGK